ncbi:PREDICTED: uncharacterized protein LOC109236913 [Nicotiana attenuata]|uniref:uncharacterized protein LOC109236913 n=1 Tax=Nicotiana attenuata TaxID=49451 RepID=UPI0009052772|nr:PREDICTED: uncharacterized protein LOC109236913 [Nicotiana attenuata]
MVTDTSSTRKSTEVTSVDPNTTVMDSSHPYYLHSSDFPGMNLVNFTFDGRGYGRYLDFKLWSRCNNMILSWLLNSLSKEIADSVIYSWIAKDPWTDLEDRFGQSNGAKLYHLGNILMISPLPSVNHAYSLLIQDEKQRKIYVNNQFPGDSSSFMAANQFSGSQKFGNSDSRGGKGRGDYKKNNQICSYYKKFGHTVDKCYMIIGFPADFKYNQFMVLTLILE